MPKPAQSSDYGVLGVVACPTIQSSQLDWASQSDSTVGCEETLLVPAFMRRSQLDKEWAER
jgi:hypothetical protein